MGSLRATGMVLQRRDCALAFKGDGRRMREHPNLMGSSGRPGVKVVRSPPLWREAKPMTARNGQDLFGHSPTLALAADHTALLTEWKQGLTRLPLEVDPCPGFRTGQWPRVYAA